MFWLFFGHLSLVSSLLFNLFPQCLLVEYTIVKQFGDFASITNGHLLFVIGALIL